MKRILFIDCWKGFLMIYIVLLHPLLFIVFSGNESSGTLTNLPVAGQFAILPLALIATWAPLFAFCSGVANAYSMHNLMQKEGTNLYTIVKGSMINSGFLFLAHLIFAVFFEHSIELNGEMHYSILGGFLETGQFHWPGLNIIHFDTLALMATANFFLALTLGLLWRKKGFQKPRRNYIYLGLIASLWLLISPTLHEIFDPIFWNSLIDGNYPLAFFLAIFVAPRQSTFPNAGFVFFGAIIGLAIANKEKIRDIKRFGYGITLFFIVVDAIIIAFEGLSMDDFVVPVVPIKIYLINLIIFIFVATIMTNSVEYGPLDKRIKFAKKTVRLRRWGLLTLSIFILEGPISVLFAYLFNIVSPGFTQNLLMVLIYITVLEVFWAIIMRLWEKIDYKGTFEHTIVVLVGRLRGRKSTKLNSSIVLHNPCHHEQKIDEIY